MQWGEARQAANRLMDAIEPLLGNPAVRELAESEVSKLTAVLAKVGEFAADGACDRSTAAEIWRKFIAGVDLSEGERQGFSGYIQREIRLYRAVIKAIG